uniref:hypothetical protein n=1 Tax=Neorhizobium sp. EC2-8 TaxID=3129230 RepID=UPI0031014F7A
MNMIGQSIDRVEDDDLLQARTRFVGSLVFDNMLHMHVVRSPYAHARLKNVTVGKAASAPGVIAVWTGNDIRELPQSGFAAYPTATCCSIGSRLWHRTNCATWANPSRLYWPPTLALPKMQAGWS